jgi:hypothetical protein
MALQAFGFHFSHRLSGQPPTWKNYTFKDTETLTKGDIVNLESGEVDLAVTSDTALVGACNDTQEGTDSTTEIEVCTDWDAVYRVTDANARSQGDLLDISGATGAQTVAAASNNEFVVVDNSTASEPTLVMINPAKNWIPFS